MGKYPANGGTKEMNPYVYSRGRKSLKAGKPQHGSGESLLESVLNSNVSTAMAFAMVIFAAGSVMAMTSVAYPEMAMSDMGIVSRSPIHKEQGKVLGEAISQVTGEISATPVQCDSNGFCRTSIAWDVKNTTNAVVKIKEPGKPEQAMAVGLSELVSPNCVKYQNLPCILFTADPVNHIDRPDVTFNLYDIKGYNETTGEGGSLLLDAVRVTKTAVTQIDVLPPAARLGQLVYTAIPHTTVYIVGSGGLYGFTSETSFHEWGYNFNQVVDANDAEKALHQIGEVPARVAGCNRPLEQIAGTCTASSGGNATPPAARLGQLVYTAIPHTTVYIVGNGGLYAFTNETIFKSWGYDFPQVVDANDAEKALRQIGEAPAKIAGCDKPLDQIAGTCPASGGGVPWSVSLSANPTSGTAPLNNVTLTATVNQTYGNYNFYFYCDGGPTIPVATSANLNAGLNGGAVAGGTTGTSQCSYTTAGTKTPKVLAISRTGSPNFLTDSSQWRQATATVTVGGANAGSNILLKSANLVSGTVNQPYSGTIVFNTQNVSSLTNLQIVISNVGDLNSLNSFPPGLTLVPNGIARAPGSSIVINDIKSTAGQVQVTFGGTPTQAGTFTFDMTIREAFTNNYSFKQTVSMLVNPVGSPATTIGFYKGSVQISSANCADTITFDVKNYTPRQVWLTQYKNISSYPVWDALENLPDTYQLTCNKDVGKYTNDVFAVINGQKGAKLGSIDFVVTASDAFVPASRPGKLVTVAKYPGTVFLVGPGNLYIFPNEATFYSWGYHFNDFEVVPANSTEAGLPFGSVVVPAKIAGCASPLDQIAGTCPASSGGSNSWSVSLSANPTSGTAPFNNVTLTATVVGETYGNYNFYFYCDNGPTPPLTTTSLNNGLSPGSGGPTTTSQCNYATAGTKIAKVLAIRQPLNANSLVDSSQWRQATATVTVTAAGTTARPTITVQSPASGVQWQVGKTYTIQWTSANMPSDAQIGISIVRSSDSSRTSLNSNTPNDGSESLTVPSSLAPGSYSIIIDCYSSTVTCYSGQSGVFSIISASSPDTSGQTTVTPKVDLKINGSDAPITVQSGSSATISYTVSNHPWAVCYKLGDWSGSVSAYGGALGSESTGNITASKTYTLTCYLSGIPVTDSVSMNITSALLPSQQPTVTFTPDGGTLVAKKDSWTFKLTSPQVGDRLSVSIKKDGVYIGSVDLCTSNFASTDVSCTRSGTPAEGDVGQWAEEILINGVSTGKTINFWVTPAVVTITPPPPTPPAGLSISPASQTDLTSPYNFTFTATGGSSAYSWTNNNICAPSAGSTSATYSITCYGQVSNGSVTVTSGTQTATACFGAGVNANCGGGEPEAPPVDPGFVTASTNGSITSICTERDADGLCTNSYPGILGNWVDPLTSIVSATKIIDLKFGADRAVSGNNLRVDFDCSNDGIVDYSTAYTSNSVVGQNICSYPSVGTYTARAKIIIPKGGIDVYGNYLYADKTATCYDRPCDDTATIIVK